MEWFALILAIPIIAIVMGVGSEMWKSFLHHQERKLEIKAGSQNAAGNGVVQQIEALREEVARLRDTSTQYDVSIQHTLEDLQHRVAYLENKARPIVAPTIADPAEEPARLARS